MEIKKCSVGIQERIFRADAVEQDKVWENWEGWELRISLEERKSRRNGPWLLLDKCLYAQLRSVCGILCWHGKEDGKVLSVDGKARKGNLWMYMSYVRTCNKRFQSFTSDSTPGCHNQQLRRMSPSLGLASLQGGLGNSLRFLATWHFLESISCSMRLGKENVKLQGKMPDLPLVLYLLNAKVLRKYLFLGPHPFPVCN